MRKKGENPHKGCVYVTRLRDKRSQEEQLTGMTTGWCKREAEQPEMISPVSPPERSIIQVVISSSHVSIVDHQILDSFSCATSRSDGLDE
jgi:hypothetical protein